MNPDYEIMFRFRRWFFAKRLDGNYKYFIGRINDNMSYSVLFRYPLGAK